MTNPKRHHIIPIVHLKHFVGTDPKGHVWTYDAEKVDVRSSVPDQTAVQSHYYSAERSDGTMDTRLEDHLSKMESKAAPVYDELLNGRLPAADSQERVDFATFLALMFVRTPGMRRMNAEMYARAMQVMAYATASNERAFESSMRRYEKERGEPIDAEAKEQLRQDMIDPSNYVIEIPKEHTFAAFPVADQLAPLFFRMKWSLVYAIQGYFITSDNPVVRMVDPATINPITGDGGFANKTAEVSFPLSPRVMLLMSWQTDTLDRGLLDRPAVENANRIRAANSDRFLYAHIRDKRLQRLAAEFKDIRPGFTTHGLGPKKFAGVSVRRRAGRS